MAFLESLVKNKFASSSWKQLVNLTPFFLWNYLVTLLKLAVEHTKKMVSNEEDSSDSHFYFNKLPDVVHRNIFDYLDVADRLRLRSVCSLWNDKLERSLRSISHLTVVYVEPLCPLVDARAFFLDYHLDGEYFHLTTLTKRLVKPTNGWINQVNDHRHIIVLDARHLKKNPQECMNAFISMLMNHFNGKMTKFTLCMPLLNGAVLPKRSDPDPVRDSSAKLLDDLTEKVVSELDSNLPAYTSGWQSVWSDRVYPGSHNTVHEPLHRFLPVTMSVRRP